MLFDPEKSRAENLRGLPPIDLVVHRSGPTKRAIRFAALREKLRKNEFVSNSTDTQKPSGAGPRQGKKL